MAAVQEIFNKCQTGLHNHASLVKSLRKIYNTMDNKKFMKEFTHCLVHILIIFKREPVAERAVDFVARFCASFTASKGGDVGVDNKENQEGGPTNREGQGVGSPSKDGRGDDGNKEDDDEEMHAFVLQVFTFLLEHHNAQDRAVRFRVCQLINKMLSLMGDDATIDDALYEEIYRCMLIRLRDKFPVVRANAVLALTRLQDPTAKDCPIIEAYKFMLACDPNCDVRRAVLSCIAASTRTLGVILERTRDLKDTVRRMAYNIIAEKVHVRALTIAQRVRLLQQGLNDRSDCVREACKNKLLRSWMMTYKDSAIDLLNCLDVENSLDVCQQLLREVIFKSSSTTMSDLITDFVSLLDERLCVRELTCETALYWRCLCEHVKACKSDEMEEQLDRILPNPLHFTEYLNKLFADMKLSSHEIQSQLRNEFILQQLIGLFSVLDLADQVHRKRVDTLVRSLLLDDYISHTVVQSLMKFYITHHSSNSEECSQSLAEIISDIREPIVAVESVVNTEQQRQRDIKVASLRVELNQLRDELDDCVQREDFSRAAEVKQRIAVVDAERMSALEAEDERPPDTQRIVKDDSLTLLKCLSIVCGMLNEPRINKLYPSILSMIDSLVLPSIQNRDPAVRNLAVRALGLCCLRSAEKSTDFMLLFLKVSRLDVETVCVTATRAIYDLLHFYGLSAFNADSSSTLESNNQSTQAKNKNKCVTNRKSLSASDDDDDDDNDDDDDDDDDDDVGGGIISLLTEQLDNDSSDIRTVCAEGFAKLMLARRIVSPSLLSRLLLHWYNPLTEDDVRLRHCLGTFLPIYAFASRQNQSVVAEAFMPTLRTLFEAPETSPLSEVRVVNVAELLVELTNHKHLLNAQQQSSSRVSAAPAGNDTTVRDHCPHDDIALSVCNEILSAPNSFNVRVLTRVLTLLELTSTNETLLKDLRVLIKKMIKVVKDKQCSRMLVSVQRHVDEMYSAVHQPSASQSTMGEESTTLAEVAEEESTMCQSTKAVQERHGLTDDSSVTTGSSMMIVDDTDSVDEFISMNESQRIKRASSKQSKPESRKFIKTATGRLGELAIAKKSKAADAIGTTEDLASVSSVSDEIMKGVRDVTDTDDDNDVEPDTSAPVDNDDDDDDDDVIEATPEETRKEMKAEEEGSDTKRDDSDDDIFYNSPIKAASAAARGGRTQAAGRGRAATAAVKSSAATRPAVAAAGKAAAATRPGTAAGAARFSATAAVGRVGGVRTFQRHSVFSSSSSSSVNTASQQSNASSSAGGRAPSKAHQTSKSEGQSSDPRTSGPRAAAVSARSTGASRSGTASGSSGSTSAAMKRPAPSAAATKTSAAAVKSGVTVKPGAGDPASTRSRFSQQTNSSSPITRSKGSSSSSQVSSNSQASTSRASNSSPATRSSSRVQRR